VSELTGATHVRIRGHLDLTGAPDADRAGVLDAMTRTLVHRGPDDEGRFADEHIALGHPPV
jgi:asparagine synthase (glutamine-hydrolysing)